MRYLSVSKVTVVMELWSEAGVVHPGLAQCDWVWHRLSCEYNLSTLPSWSHVLVFAIGFCASQLDDPLFNETLLVVQ